MSRWVAHNILEGRDDNERVSIFLKFLKLAVKLQRCNNYNTSAAIVAGLSEVSITRLKNIVEVNYSLEIRLSFKKLTCLF